MDRKRRHERSERRASNDATMRTADVLHEYPQCTASGGHRRHIEDTKAMPATEALGARKRGRWQLENGRTVSFEQPGDPEHDVIESRGVNQYSRRHDDIRRKAIREQVARSRAVEHTDTRRHAGPAGGPSHGYGGLDAEGKDAARYEMPEETAVTAVDFDDETGVIETEAADDVDRARACLICPATVEGRSGAMGAGV